MERFYYILAGASGLYLAVQVVALVFFNKRLFPDTGELFTQKNRRLDWQAVFPKDLLRLMIFIFSGSLLGLILNSMDVAGWISLPCAAAGGIAINFLISTVISPLFHKANNSGKPDLSAENGIDAVVTESITADSYGKISIENNGKTYTYNAVSANGNDIPEGETVTVISCEDGLCFVETTARLYDVLFEENIDINV